MNKKIIVILYIWIFSSWNCERKFSFLVIRDPVPPLHPPLDDEEKLNILMNEGNNWRI